MARARAALFEYLRAARVWPVGGFGGAAACLVCVRQVLESLNGVDAWRDSELSGLRAELSCSQWHSLGCLVDVLEARLEQIEKARAN